LGDGNINRGKSFEYRVLRSISTKFDTGISDVSGNKDGRI
jgi:hypothetical protein